MKVDLTKAVGPGKISLWIINEGKAALCLPHSPLCMVTGTCVWFHTLGLTLLYRSLGTEDTPESRKTADLVPLFKKGERRCALDCGPVSLTSTPCRVMGEDCEASGTFDKKILCNSPPARFQI